MSEDVAKKTRRQKAFAVLPTLLTLGNAVCGFGAITVLARISPSFEVGPLDLAADPEASLQSAREIVTAAQLIFLAMLFDALDGSAARLTNQTTEFGAMLDSLCDVVSFGVAPAFMMLKLTDANNYLMETLSPSEGVPSRALGIEVTSPFPAYSIDFLWAIAALFLACAILRLARFNVETDEEDSHEGFSGLPSPAAAAVIASFPIGAMALIKKIRSENAVAWAEPFGSVAFPALAVTLPFLTLATAMLMVSRIPYPHLFNQILKGDKGRVQMLQMVFTLALIFVVGGVAVPVLVCWFAFSGPVKVMWEKTVHRGGLLPAAAASDVATSSDPVGRVSGSPQESDTSHDEHSHS